MEKTLHETDNYIAGFSGNLYEKLSEIRQIIKSAAPQALETFKYAIPTFDLKGNLVHFAAFKNHIGFYPAPSAIKTFKQELSDYKTSKGAIRFPLENPLPSNLITKIVLFRVKENLEKAELGKTKNKKLI